MSITSAVGGSYLARKQRESEPTLPEITRVGIYYCRHGYLWSMDANEWLNNPVFSDLERWFFARAAELYPLAPQSLKM